MAKFYLLTLEPRLKQNIENSWPEPSIIQSIGSKIRIPNNTNYPIVLKRHEHIAQISSVYSPNESPSIYPTPVKQNAHVQSTTPHYSKITLDPDHILPSDAVRSFTTLHKHFNNTFNPAFSGYNGAIGPLQAVVNMGPVLPPQRKGRLPQYARNRLEELQDKFDQLESI